MTPQDSTPWLRKTALVLLVLYWTALTIGTHWPIPHHLRHLQESDKVLHLAAYCGLALLACVNVALRRPFGWRPALAVLVVVAGLAALDEITQPPFGRYGDVQDWVADMIGASASVGPFWVVSPLVARRRQLNTGQP
jgi:VanZ family protein